MNQGTEIDQDKLDETALTILGADYVTALTGAGMGVESGIPPIQRPRWTLDQARGTAHGWVSTFSGRSQEMVGRKVESARADD